MAAENGLGQMFVAGAGLDEMTAQVRRFNTIRAGMGLPPDQPTTLLWMYCVETASESEEGWEYFRNQLRGAAPLLRVEQPGLRRHSRLRGVPQTPNGRRRCGRREPRGAARHPADRLPTRSSRRSERCSTPQPGDGGHPHVLRRDAARRRRKACGCSRKSPSSGAGDADLDQPSRWGSRTADASIESMSIAGELARFVTGSSVLDCRSHDISSRRRPWLI